MQAARNLFITTADTLKDCKMLVRDRAGQFTDASDQIFRSEGIKIAKTPLRTPVVNCYFERWFGTLRRELLDNQHRPHRTFDQQPPDTPTPACPGRR